MSNGNRTEWSPIRSVIIQLITKFITSMITNRILLPINQKTYNFREWPAHMLVTLPAKIKRGGHFGVLVGMWIFLHITVHRKTNPERHR